MIVPARFLKKIEGPGWDSFEPDEVGFLNLDQVNRIVLIETTSHRTVRSDVPVYEIIFSRQPTTRTFASFDITLDLPWAAEQG